MAVKAVAYVRVSSAGQSGEEGYSLPAQIKMHQEYAKLHNLEIVQVFEEVESAKKAGRKVFNSMVSLFEAQKNMKADKRITVLMVEKIDRLSRNWTDVATIDDLMKLVGLELHCVRDNRIINECSSPTDKFMFDIMVAQARHYILNLSQMVKKGMGEKAAQGYFPTKTPLGYLNQDSPDGRKIIVPDPSRAPLIRKMFDHFATESHSLKSLTDQLYEEGLRTLGGLKVHKSAIQVLINNPIYHGDFRHGGRIYTNGRHEPLISKELFDRVQRILTNHAPRRNTRRKHTWTFQGLIKCGHCGTAMSAEIKKGKYIYYSCSKSKGPCPEKRYPREEEIDRQFAQAISQLQLQSGAVEDVRHALLQSHGQKITYQTHSLDTLNSSLVRVQTALDRNYDLHVRGTADEATYTRTDKNLRQEQEEIQAKIRSHEAADESYMENGVKILELVKNAHRLYEPRNSEEKRALLGFVCQNSTWANGKLTVEFRNPFNLFADFKREMEKKSATPIAESGAFSRILPGLDSN